MKRLTSNKETKDMTMIELAHNSCYIKNGKARYRDFNKDWDTRDFARDILLESYVLNDEDIEIQDDCAFDETLLDYLQYGHRTIGGLIGLLYRNLWAMADLREKLKEYEDLEEQGLLLRLPCKVGDTVYYISEGFVEPCTVEVIFLADYTDEDGNYSYLAEIHYDREDCPYVSTEIYFTDIGKTVFLTQSEAEQKLKELRGEAE